MDKYKTLKKEILKIEKQVQKAVDKDRKVDFMGNGCNAFELSPLVRHLVHYINELDKE